MNKKSFGFFFLFLFIASKSVLAQNKTAQSTPPNVIIIFADDLGYGDLSCYGHPTISTPNLDRMAAEGMRFTQFYVGANVCTPSRAALLTGRLPIRYGVAGSANTGVFFPNSALGLPQSEITMATLLKTKGYETAIVGKWHLGHLPQYLPNNHGFGYFFGLPYSNDMIPEGPGWPDLSLYRNKEVIEWAPDQTQLTKRYTEEAISFIKKNKAKPFFLYYPNNFPHVPLYASAAFKGKSKRGLYGDVVTELDWSVGQILTTLKKEGLDKNTLVIFTSDNGPWLLKKLNGGSAGLLFEGKGSAYEGGMRVPAIAWWPGTIKANQICEELAATMDLMPTIAGLASAVLPDNREYDGKDMMPLLKSEKKNIRDVVYYYYRDELYAIRKGPWKAHFITKPSYRPEILPTMHDTPVLFNLLIDPSEKWDVSKDHPEIVKELTAEYVNFKASVKPVVPLLDSIYWKKGAPPKEWWKGPANKQTTMSDHK